MQLYSAPLSPFSARVRGAFYAKAVAVDVRAPPEEGLRSEAYLQLNPLGKLPVLVLDTGDAVPESEVIIDLLETLHPHPPLSPADPAEHARHRLLGRLADLYVMAAVAALFPFLDGADQTSPEAASGLAKLKGGLSAIEHYLREDDADRTSYTLADCMLTPMLFYVSLVEESFAPRVLLAEYPRLAAYAQSMRARQASARVLSEMEAALAAMT